MRILLCLLVMTMVGCGGSENVNKPGTPTEDQIKADMEEQKRIEIEERGTPVNVKKRK